MPDVEFTNLLVVAVIALLAPLTLGLAPALRFPSVVLEIIAGVVVGPQVLGWVEVDVPVSIAGLAGTRVPAVPGRTGDRRPPAAGTGAQACPGGLRRDPGARGSRWASASTPPAGSAAQV